MCKRALRLLDNHLRISDVTKTVDVSDTKNMKSEKK